MKSTTGAPLRVEREGALTTITIDAQPMNLFDAAMLDAWVETVDALVASPPRGLLIRAEGKVVSAGVDVEVFRNLGTVMAQKLWSEQVQMIRGLESLPCPTVFAAHELTLTSAFEIALACDFLLATPAARFGLVEKRVGITPSMGGVQRLAHIGGVRRAKELVMSADIYAAETLLDWGVVNQIMDEDGFEESSKAYALQLAAGPTRAHRATKLLAQAYTEGGLDCADARLPAIGGALFSTRDHLEALGAFLEHGPSHTTTFTGH